MGLDIFDRCAVCNRARKKCLLMGKITALSKMVHQILDFPFFLQDTKGLEANFADTTIARTIKITPCLNFYFQVHTLHTLPNTVRETTIFLRIRERTLMAQPRYCFFQSDGIASHFWEFQFKNTQRKSRIQFFGRGFSSQPRM